MARLEDFTCPQCEAVFLARADVGKATCPECLHSIVTPCEDDE